MSDVGIFVPRALQSHRESQMDVDTWNAVSKKLYKQKLLRARRNASIAQVVLLLFDKILGRL